MIPAWAGRYVGIPFVSGGRDRFGCDCYGLVRLVLAEQFGYDLPLLSLDYRNAAVVAETAPVLRARLPLLAGEQLGSAEPGAVAVMRFRGMPSHVGVFVDDAHILHTLEKIGAHIARAESGMLRGGIEGIYRVDSRYRVTASI